MKLKKLSKQQSIPKRYIAYADGACTQLGIGGAGGFLCTEGEIKSVFYLDQNGTTNNQMELSAVILAILAFKEIANKGDSLIINSDSQYVVKGITEWIYNWVKKKWRSTSGPVLNKEVWERLHDLRNEIEESGYEISFNWVKGHNGNAGNEFADFIASKLSIDDHINVTEKKLLDKLFSIYEENSSYRSKEMVTNLATVGRITVLCLELGDEDINETLDVIMEAHSNSNLFI